MNSVVGIFYIKLSYKSCPELENWDLFFANISLRIPLNSGVKSLDLIHGLESAICLTYFLYGFVPGGRWYPPKKILLVGDFVIFFSLEDQKVMFFQNF